MSRVEGKVALITGAARGQGRAHAIRLAEEGADIIALDIPGDIIDVSYPSGTTEELLETARAVEELDRRIVTIQADVRDADAVKQGVDDAVQELGRLDIISANAGIASNPPHLAHEIPAHTWQQMLDINLTGGCGTRSRPESLISSKEAAAVPSSSPARRQA